MTMREQLTLDNSKDPKMDAAILLAIFENGGSRKNDESMQERCMTLYDMTDEQFDKEHQRVKFEQSCQPS